MMSEVTLIDSPIYSFAPFAGSQSKVLILGTIPGKESLKMNAYYAHPQNAFWKIIFDLHDLPFSIDNLTRREVLHQNGIAIWDVLKTCKRESSLDKDIRMEGPNDLRTFLLSYPGIKRIFFNGKGAAMYFRRYFPDISLPNQILPSTSPAHAINWKVKLAAWQAIKTTEHK